MPLDTIEKAEILNWDSKEDIAETLEKRGLERTNLGEEDEIVMELDEDKFVAIVAATDDKTPSDYNTRMTSARQTQVVSTDDFEQFTFTTRRRAWDKHGQIKYNRWQIEKDQFRPGGEANTALEKLNNIEHGDSQSINQLYETKKVVNEFYDKFESIRADMVHKVSGIPEDEGEKKQNYAQTIFDRLIFLHFIQEKKLLNFKQDYLERNHDEVIEDGGDVYEEFYKPLFFKWLATDQEHPEHTLPYLNGGLFTKTDVEREYEDVRLGEDTEETNKLFTEILDFLGDWNWHADERLDIVDPNRLSPELLGHIFEKTVNQKEMGAYYTPEEITHFMSRNTIQPYILDRINEKFDRDYEEIDELFKIPEEVDEEDENSVIIGDIEEIKREEIEHLYFEVLQDLKVLDPAVGSGAFLLAAQEVLIDIYMSALQYFQNLDKEASWEMTERIQDVVTELENNAAKTSAEKSMHAKRQIILNNLYGVDIDKGATEICKLRLWLSIVADLEKGDDPHSIETLPNIDFNIRQGNSLIGFTEPIEKALKDEEKDMGDAQANLNQYSPDAIYKKYDEIIKKVKTYKKHEREGNGEKAKKARQEAFKLLEKYREDPDEKILQQFHEAGIEDVDMEDIKDFSPFHWVLEFAEVYSEGGFDVIIGNPPWEVVKSDKEEFFSKYDPAFRTKSPNQKKEKRKSLLESKEVEEEWKKHKKVKRNLSKFYAKSGVYELQSPDVGGQARRELSSLFLERVFDIGHDDGYTSLILPGKTFIGASAKDLRSHIFEDSNLKETILFENKGTFEGVDNRYKFGIMTFRNFGNTEVIKGTFMRQEPNVLKKLDDLAIKIPVNLIERYSPLALSFPLIQDEEEIDLLDKMSRFNEIRSKESSWHVDIYKEELNRTRDADKFRESKDEGEYPVLGGKNIYQFCYDNSFLSDLEDYEFWSVNEDKPKSAKARIRGKNVRKLKSKLFEKFGNSKAQSQKKFVNNLLKEKRGEELKPEDVKLDCTEFRIFYRHITNSTNERTMISSVVPPGYVCHNALATIRPIEIELKEENLHKENLKEAYHRIFEYDQLFFLNGILNSLPFDYLMRTKIEENVVSYKLKETQAPKSPNEFLFEKISTNSARLNAYGQEFLEVRENLGIEPETDEAERKRLQAEIDAAAFHAYGLERDETKYVLNNFHKVNNPRIMTDDYFDMVLEKYDELDEEGPFE